MPGSCARGGAVRGGAFTTAGVCTVIICRWDGTAWSALGSGMDNGLYVNPWRFAPDGSLYGGLFPLRRVDVDYIANGWQLVCAWVGDE